MTQTIAVIRGDGIGPEIMDATLSVLDKLGLGLEYDFVDAGLSAYEKCGELLPAATMDAITKHRVALKSPHVPGESVAPDGSPGAPGTMT